MTAAAHPLCGRVLQAVAFRRRNSVLFLVVTLPDGTPGTVPADATSVFGEAVVETGSEVLSGKGLVCLHALVVTVRAAGNRARSQTRK
ncbi:MAG: hypothetical protein M3N98_06260 [Actinomycetota bacterium]|nr:hypothetical protein [Actinomycetota bacterium]